MKPIIECVPNISEGRRPEIYNAIAAEVEKVEGVTLLDVDPGAATNRTVITFVGSPENVIDAAFLLIKKASELIDMSQHSGEHPRFGATDVCPLVPVSGISLKELIPYAHQLGKRIGEELNLSGFYYESAASKPERTNLATVRSGEYEGLNDKLENPEWKTDFGPQEFNPSFGCMALGVRDFLVAYNVNLNTSSVRRANSVAFDVRENGRVKREGHPVTGKIVRDENGDAVRSPGMLKAVKGIGWYIEEYGIAQVSMNLTNISITKVHEAFEACRKSANNRGMRVTGSELVGLIPKKAMIEAGKYYLKQQQRSTGVAESEIIKIAIKSMGLDELSPFDPNKKIIEYVMQSKESQPLLKMPIKAFAEETASESPAPGGGSISAYAGALGAALATMVANLSANKRGWDDKIEVFSNHAENGQTLMSDLLNLVDEDTNAFNKIMEAFRLAKNTDEEKAIRKEAIENATKNAIEVPFNIMKKALESMELIKEMAVNGNPNSVSDAGVAALCARTAVRGAFLNVKINAGDLNDTAWGDQKIKAGNGMQTKAELLENEIIQIVEGKL